eukprot:TRINITY_DN5109_c0_g5_i2.p1 TRINITY_DN5109_c0_g5~~TRINITY_DN5109_c0_g5_i2.p1  ORF type:complete len:772 (+),score=60.84 TRINITY_DN5109_c0_g5_i2:47-2317(+)
MAFLLSISPLSLVVLCVGWVVGGSATKDDNDVERRYCIVGAGPGGIQLGHFFKHAGRDYVIYERNQQAGSFFQTYPRHRMLISLNKRFVPKGRSSEFAFRHDWNSLIDVRPPPNQTRPVTERSKLLFPPADVVAEYLAEFAEEQARHIEYGVRVERISRSSDGGFRLALRKLDLSTSEERETSSLCREVIFAGGFDVPRPAASVVDGARHVAGYEDLPVTGEMYEGKSVVILGLGNAALETAQELQKYTSDIHVLARSRALPEGGKGVRFAYQTHYVGDIRAGRTTILDTYLLKSLDTFGYDALNNAARLVLMPCKARLCLWQVLQEDCANEQCHTYHTKGAQNLSYWLQIGKWVKGSRIGRQVRSMLSRYSEDDWLITESDFNRGNDDEGKEDENNSNQSKKISRWSDPRRRELLIQEEVFVDEFEELRIKSNLLRSNRDLLDKLVPLRSRYSHDPIRDPVDHVIRCFGWRMNVSIFDESLHLQTTHFRKYPAITGAYAAKGVPGLYFAGTLNHGLDFRKSAGGFIHGFRYTARVLFKLLEETNFDIPFPHTSVPLIVQSPFGAELTQGLKTLISKLQGRINEASAPYQMFQALGDMVVFDHDRSNDTWTAKYMEEVPLSHFHERFRNQSRLTWVFKYGDDFYGPQVLGADRVGTTDPLEAEKSNFLHPHLQYYPQGSDSPLMQHWLPEDVNTQWHNDEVSVSLARFVARVTADATKNDNFADQKYIDLALHSSSLCEGASNQCDAGGWIDFDFE